MGFIIVAFGDQLHLCFSRSFKSEKLVFRQFSIVQVLHSFLFILEFNTDCFCSALFLIEALQFQTTFVFAVGLN